MKSNTVLSHPLLQFTQKQVAPSVHITKVFLRKITWDNTKADGSRNAGSSWILSNSQRYRCDYKLPDGTDVRFSGSFGTQVASADVPVTMFISDSVTRESLSDSTVALLRSQWCEDDTNVCYLLSDSNANTFLPMSAQQSIDFLSPSSSDSDTDSVQVSA